VQQRCLRYLRRIPEGREHGFPVAVSTTVIADVVFSHRSRRLAVKTTSTHDQRKSVQRALRGLEKSGLVERLPWKHGQVSYWRITKAGELR
jgi:hypothetical protein